jgi:hypothetical protein
MIAQSGSPLIRNRKLHVLLAAALVGASAVGIEMLFGVRFGEVLRFAAYEPVYVFLPGWMVYVALSSNPGGLLRQIAIGAGVGYALECMAFGATAAAGVPGWFAAYPAAVGIVAAPMIWKRWRSGYPIFRFPSPPTVWSWALALTCVAMLVYLALAYFTTTPLPHGAGDVRYFMDTVWDISCAAEAKYHWPITDPHVSGEPFYYYTFVFMHLAAVSRLTGLELPLIVFRLYIVSFFLVFALQLYVAGSEMGKKRLAGVLAVVITLFMVSVELWPLQITRAFANDFYTFLYISPTYMLGLLMFTPLVVEMYDRLAASSQRGSAGSWFVIFLLIFASGGAKATVLPVFAGGLGVYFIWILLATRSLDWPAPLTAVLALATFAGWGKLVYSHSGMSTIIHPLASFTYMPFVGRYFPFAKGTTLWARFGLLLLTPICVAGMFGIRTLTTVWLLRGDHSRRSLAQIWLLSLFFISLVPFLLLDEEGLGQYYFLYNGIAALSISAACALCGMFEESGGWPQGRKVALFGLVGVLAVNGFSEIPLNYYERTHKLVSRKANSRKAKRIPVAAQPDLTPALLAGLDWIKLNTSPTDVLAVSNQCLDEAKNDPRYFYYSAFSERRVFLEGWSYSRVSDHSDRIALNKQVFNNADPEALRALVDQYGVRWLVVDKVHGPANPLVSKLAKLVYSNPDVDIYTVR